MEIDSDLLDQLLARANRLGVLARGKFKLTSGQTSNYYIDGRRLSLDSRGADLIGRLILARLGRAKSIGGPATGAIPIVAASLAVAGRAGRPLAGFYVRKAAQDHGQKQSLEGRPASPLVLVDDTCTTGGSLLALADGLERQGKVIDRIITVFDRGGSQAIRDRGLAYDSLLSVRRGRLVVGRLEASRNSIRPARRGLPRPTGK